MCAKECADILTPNHPIARRFAYTIIKKSKDGVNSSKHFAHIYIELVRNFIFTF